MYVIESRNAAPFGSVTAFRFVSLIERAIDGIAAWRGARATERVLRDLSDKQLADIGLHRGEIPSLAARLAQR